MSTCGHVDTSSSELGVGFRLIGPRRADPSGVRIGGGGLHALIGPGLKVVQGVDDPSADLAIPRASSVGAVLLERSPGKPEIATSFGRPQIAIGNARRFQHSDTSTSELTAGDGDIHCRLSVGRRGLAAKGVSLPSAARYGWRRPDRRGTSLARHLSEFCIHISDRRRRAPTLDLKMTILNRMAARTPFGVWTPPTLSTPGPRDAVDQARTACCERVMAIQNLEVPKMSKFGTRRFSPRVDRFSPDLPPSRFSTCPSAPWLRSAHVFTRPRVPTCIDKRCFAHRCGGSCIGTGDFLHASKGHAKNTHEVYTRPRIIYRKLAKSIQIVPG